MNPTAAAALAVSRVKRRSQNSDLPDTLQGFAERFRHFTLRTTPDFHKPWYAALDDPELTRLFLLAPREHAKTSVVLTYVIRAICLNRRIRIGIVSQTDALARAFMREVAAALEDPELVAAYGLFRSNLSPVWNQHELSVIGGASGKDVTLFAVGRGGQVTGRHTDILIVDDLESRDSVQSDEVRAQTREWFSKELTNVLSAGGKFVVIGTRKHHDDLYTRFLKPHSGWHVIDNAKQVWDAQGDPIWPEMWSREALLARKAELDAVDVLAWPQEYLNRPLPSETQMFDPMNWPTYVLGREPSGCTTFQAWDLAISEKQSADFTAGAAARVHPTSGDLYLLDAVWGHWAFNAQLAEFESFGKRHHPDVVGIEKAQYQAAAVEEAARRTMLPIKALVPDKDKVTRARLLEARAALGKVFRPVIAMPDGTFADPPWWPEVAEQFAFFPAGAHDDIVDAFAYVALMAADLMPTDTDWLYRIWRCSNCGHGFVWQAKRPCPRCGTSAPADDPFGDAPGRRGPEPEADGGTVLGQG